MGKINRGPILIEAIETDDEISAIPAVYSNTHKFAILNGTDEPRVVHKGDKIAKQRIAKIKEENPTWSIHTIGDVEEFNEDKIRELLEERKINDN